jgi:malate dehydrogenase (oxaloacetate-decarboxylating)
MGIPIGKLALYTAGAGIHPSRCLPISLDVGTNNAELLADPLYLGYREPRIRGEDYDSLVDEFVEAVRLVYPRALVQWEDFANLNSFDILQRYRESILSFNDDIQGTAAIVTGGLQAVEAHTGVRLRDHRIVIVGAGSAGVGIRDLLALGMKAQGATDEDVAARLWVLDSRGLLVDGRGSLTPMKQRVAAPRAAVEAWPVADEPIGLVDVVRNTEATVIIGVSGVPGVFSEDAIRMMAKATDRPIVLPLSNPTSHSEAIPSAVAEWSDGAAIVATGSPFAPVARGSTIQEIGQANNVFVFPGIGLGALAVGATQVTDAMLLAAGRALGGAVDREAFDSGRVFPNITAVRDVSRAVALAVAQQAIADGVAEPHSDLEQLIERDMWYPVYPIYEKR